MQAISTSSVLLSASLAEPDADGRSLHASLSAELAGVLGVLRDLHLLHLLTERGTITGSVLSDDSNLLRSLRLRDKKKKTKVLSVTKLFDEKQRKRNDKRQTDNRKRRRDDQRRRHSKYTKGG